MDVSSLGPSSAQADLYPLLMEQENHNDRDHIIDIRNNESGSSLSPPLYEQSPHSHLPQHRGRVLSSSTEVPTHQSSSFSQQGVNHTNFSSARRREDAHGLRSNRSPLNSGLWISVELAVTVAQIVAAIVVLSLAKDEHPHAPLFAWIVGYASGCVATLPILYWRFRTYNQGTDQDADQSRRGSSQTNNQPDSMPYTAVSVVQAPVEANHPGIGASSREGRVGENFSLRSNGRVDHFKMALDCFFAVWFVVGNVWIFGGHSSSTDAPKLYRLCIVFLTFSCIGYAMPFILCATICCCLPCLVSILGIRENLSQTRGATVESINALPIYKFMSKSVNDQNDLGTVEGGFLLSGSEKIRLISGEDAVCCICLAKYADDDELRELKCSHVFHVDCVDKWLKINASCPLCKSEVGESSSAAAPS